MNKYFHVLFCLLTMVFSLPTMAKNLGEHPLYSNLGADSIVVTMISDDVSPMTRITRYEFDSWNDCSSETTIRDSIYITDVLDSLKKCDIISTLSHRTDEVVMNMEVFYKGNMYWSRWLSDDIVDIRCRLLIYKNNKILVVWLSDNGEFDFDIVKCSGGRGAYKLLKRLVDGSSHNDISDYLGNVRCVVREDGELRESNGYYPYGMVIPYGGDIQPYKYGGQPSARRSGRCNVGYQAGGNIQGPPSGNEMERMHGISLYDSRARWYDPTLGRTTTMDSEAGTYPGISPYLWCAATPIRFTDPSSRTISVMVCDEIYLYDYDNSCFVDSKGNQTQLTDEYSNYVLDALTTLREGKTGNEIVEYLSNDKNHNVFISQNNENSYDRNSEEYIINWNATSDIGGPSYFGIGNDYTRERPSYVGLAHEMAHIQDLWQGTMDNSVWIVTESGYKVTKSEIYSCTIENKIRAEHNVPLRTHYVVYKGDIVAPYSTLFSPYCTLYMLQHSKKKILK